MRSARRWLSAVICLAGLLTPEEAAAEDLELELPVFGRTAFSMTSTTLLRYRGANYDPNPHDDDFFSIYQRLNLALQGEQLRAELRIDAFVPFTETVFGPYPCEVIGSSACYLDWDVRPERFVLRWEPGEWTVELGDSQTVLGRGVALSFRKVDLLGVDNALRGGHIRYQGRTFFAQFHGGLANPQNQDPLDLSIIEDPLDVVVAGRVGVNLPGSVPLATGIQAVRVMFEDDSVVTGRAVDVAGWTLEAPALAQGKIALYGEANMMRRTESLFDDDSESFGRGIYASAQLQLEKVTLLLEWKDYQNFLVAPTVLEGDPWRIYNAAPNVEYDGPQRLRAIGNQRGGGARLDYAFLPGPWAFSVNAVVYGLNEDPEPTSDPFNGVLVTHGWTSLTRRQEYGDDVNWGLTMDLGSRFEILLHDEGSLQAGALDRWMLHGQAEVAIGSGDHSVDVVVDHRHERERRFTGEARDFQIGGVGVTYSYGIPLALTLGLRWTDFQPGIVEQREEKGYNLFGGEFYPFLEARWTFKPGTFVSAFVGQTPGGQLCSGGVCRDVPTYEGFRLQFVGRL